MEIKRVKSWHLQPFSRRQDSLWKHRPKAQIWIYGILQARCKTGLLVGVVEAVFKSASSKRRERLGKQTEGKVPLPGSSWSYFSPFILVYGGENASSHCLHECLVDLKLSLQTKAVMSWGLSVSQSNRLTEHFVSTCCQLKVSGKASKNLQNLTT